MASYDRTAVGYYAGSFYDTPCEDGFIATSTGICNVETEFKNTFTAPDRQKRDYNGKKNDLTARRL